MSNPEQNAGNGTTSSEQTPPVQLILVGLGVAVLCFGRFYLGSRSTNGGFLFGLNVYGTLLIGIGGLCMVLGGLVRPTFGALGDIGKGVVIFGSLIVLPFAVFPHAFTMLRHILGTSALSQTESYIGGWLYITGSLAGYVTAPGLAMWLTLRLVTPAANTGGEGEAAPATDLVPVPDTSKDSMP